MAMPFRAALLAAIVCLSGSAHAQGIVEMDENEMNDEQAKEHFKLGQSFYAAGRFQAAAEEWEKAYALSPRDTLLYNQYIAHRDGGNTGKAVEALRRYLATPQVDPGERINLEARLKVLEEQLAEQLAAAAEAAPAAEPEPEPMTDPEPAPPPETNILPYVLIGTGGAMIVGGVVTGLIANGKVSDIEDSCPMDRCPASFDLEGERDGARTLVTLTDILLVGGAVVGGIGVVLALVDEKESESAGLDAPTFSCGPSGCFSSLRGRF